MFEYIPIVNFFENPIYYYIETYVVAEYIAMKFLCCDSYVFAMFLRFFFSVGFRSVFGRNPVNQQIKPLTSKFVKT